MIKSHRFAIIPVISMSCYFLACWGQFSISPYYDYTQKYSKLKVGGSLHFKVLHDNSNGLN